MKRRSILVGAGGAALLAGAGAFGWRSAIGSAGDYEAYAERLRDPLLSRAGIVHLVRYATSHANLGKVWGNVWGLH